MGHPLPILISFHLLCSSFTIFFRFLVPFQLILLLTHPFFNSVHALLMFAHLCIPFHRLHFFIYQLGNVLLLFLAQFVFVALPSQRFSFLPCGHHFGCLLLLALFQLLVVVVVHGRVLHVTIFYGTNSPHAHTHTHATWRNSIVIS